MSRRRSTLLGVAIMGAVACTGGGDRSPPTGAATSTTPVETACFGFVRDRNAGECLDTFDLEGTTYRVTCVPVPDVLLDVTVPARWGGAAVRAIAAVPTVHGVAVTAGDEECGAFALAMPDGLDDATAAQLVEEMERAATLPPDLEKEPPEPAG